MKICIMGSGNVGLKLVDSFIPTGHVVKLDTRSPGKKVASWAARRGGKIYAKSFFYRNISWRKFSDALDKSSRLSLFLKKNGRKAQAR